MGKLRYIIPSLVVVAAIAAAIVIIVEKPFGNDDPFEGPGQREATSQSDDQAERATPTPKPKVAEGPLAPELAGIVAWINSQPTMINDLRGKVVLVDFWTYTCVNCIRTFPYLKIWHAKYADDGLVILGVHAPEFDFEKKLENVQNAVAQYGIDWRVALDNDFATWRAYRNQFWPAKYLIDKDGVIRYTHFGEGAYDETELKIRELLEETGADLSLLDAALPSAQSIDPSYLGDPSARLTRELYAGWDRGYPDRQFGAGYVAQSEYYAAPDRVVTYEDRGRHKSHQIYLQGPWHNGKENLTHARGTTDFEDYILLNFSAKSVNVVIEPQGEATEPLKVLVTLDGDYLTDSNKGEDVVVEEDGKSYLYVDRPAMYAVIEAPSYGAYQLKLSPNSADFAIFAFTFGVYESGV